MREVAQKAGFDVLDPPDVNAVDVQDQLRAFRGRYNVGL
jgi:hypothetical protein